MANYQNLKNSIAQVIKTNGNQEITGQLLQNTLNNIVNSIGTNYTFAGVATPATNPGAPDQNIFYLAGDGTYANFGNKSIAAGNIGVLKYNGAWSLDLIKVGGDVPINELNISKMFPTGGTGSSNRYTLADAIAKVPNAYKNVIGLKITFLSDESKAVETYVYQGGTFTSADSWVQGSGGSGAGAIKLEWKGNKANTRATLKKAEQKQGCLITYKSPTEGWIIEQFIADDFVIGYWHTDKSWRVISDNKSSSILYDDSSTHLQVSNIQDAIYALRNALPTLISSGSKDGYIDLKGNFISHNEYRVDYTDKIEVKEGDIFLMQCTSEKTISGTSKCVLFTEEGTPTNFKVDDGYNVFIVIPKGYTHAVFSCTTLNIPSWIKVYKGGDINRLYSLLLNLDSKQADITKSLSLLSNLYRASFTSKILSYEPCYVNSEGRVNAGWGYKAAVVKLDGSEKVIKAWSNVIFPDKSSNIIAFYNAKSFSECTPSTFISGVVDVKKDIPIAIPTNAKILILGNIGKFDETSGLDSVFTYLGDVSDYSDPLKSTKKIICWGDSLTFGIGSTNIEKYSYPVQLQNLLGKDFEVIKQGYPGATSHEIGGIQGGIPIIVKTDFTLPKDTTKVPITTTNAYKPNNFRSSFFSMDCFINGVHCKFDGNGSIARVSADEKPVLVKKDTIVISKYLQDYKEAYIQIIYIGTNGEYRDNAELISQIKNMTEAVELKRFIVISLATVTSTYTAEKRDALEMDMIKAFGEKFFNWRKYLLNDALTDAEISPTLQDTEAIQQGKTPPSLTSVDETHFTDKAYELLAKQLYNRMLELGWI